jgi:hypothetical protein
VDVPELEAEKPQGDLGGAAVVAVVDEAPRPPPVPKKRRLSRLRLPHLPKWARLPRVSPRGLAALSLGGGVVLMATILVPLAVTSRRVPVAAAATDNVADDAGAAASAAEAPDAAPPHVPSVWRVAMMGSDESIEILEGTVGKRPFGNALVAAGISKAEAHRVIKALEPVKKVEKCGAHDSFTIARDKGSGHVVAFELEESAADIYQIKSDGPDDGPLPQAEKLELRIERKRIAVAFTVGDDLRSAITNAGLDDDVLKLLSDALEGHADAGSLRAGARLRLIATEDLADGEFSRYVALNAVEYFPPRPKAPSLRVYWYQRGGVPMDPTDEEAARRAKRHAGGFYDAKGRQPYEGGWRSPIPFARVTSRFNPKRMHPVLHVVMPHNGVDFGATTGTPIYSTAAGIVKSAGDGGACGNMVQVDHPSGLTSAYCHMSRFAAGIHPGQHVESRQLLGYVGATGRVTGPHLHFAIKRGEQFIDPLTLRLDGMRVLPHGDRGPFAKEKEELDAALDTIPLPAFDGGTEADDNTDGGEGEVILEETP